MNDNELIALGSKITKLTDIYSHKKSELIDLCKSKQWKNVGTVDNLRAMFSKYYKGIIALDDIEKTLSELQKHEIQKKSIKDKIDIKDLLIQSNLSDSSPETSNSTKNRSITKYLKNITNDLGNNTNKLKTQADKISDTSNTLYQNNLEQTFDNNYSKLINLDPNETTQWEPIYEKIYSPNKIESNLNTTFFGNLRFIPQSTPEKSPIANIKSKTKMEKMIIKPEYFSCQEDIQHFFIQNEKAGLINNCDDNDKVKFLSIFLKDTVGTFLENLENIKTHWNWVELKNEF